MSKETKSKEQISQDKQKLIGALEALKENVGWQIIVKALEVNIKEAEKRLFGELELEDDQTIFNWQKVRSDRIGIINLPETLIRDNKELDQFEPDLDPYADD